MCKSDVWNFNDNAANTKLSVTGSKVQVFPTLEQNNRNWNAGDSDAAQKVVGTGGVDDVNRKVSIVDPGAAKDVEEDELSDMEETDVQEEDNIARLRRLSSISAEDSDAIKMKVQKHRSSRLRRFCVRRCIAEDPDWDLKTVPNLDMLVVKYFVDNYAGTN